MGNLSTQHARNELRNIFTLELFTLALCRQKCWHMKLSFRLLCFHFEGIDLIALTRNRNKRQQMRMKLPCAVTCNREPLIQQNKTKTTPNNINFTARDAQYFIARCSTRWAVTKANEQ
eukprot:m.8733 g.8733  ORF g.8733 m.8733 type:complete len:118 (+) comp5389_c0_seq1:2963-3316(+)